MIARGPGHHGLGVLTSIGLSTALMVCSRSPPPSPCCPRCSPPSVIARQGPAARSAYAHTGRGEHVVAVRHRVSGRPWPYLARLGRDPAPPRRRPVAADCLARGETRLLRPTHRQAYDCSPGVFGVGINAPLVVVTDLSSSPVSTPLVSRTWPRDRRHAGDASSASRGVGGRSQPSSFTALPTTGPATRPRRANDPRSPSHPGQRLRLRITAPTDDLNAQLSDTCALIGAVIAVSSCC